MGSRALLGLMYHCHNNNNNNNNEFFIQESFDSSRAIGQTEFGTTSLSQATIKMEEYHDLLKNTEAWIENTSRLLANPADHDSSKTLSHHASTLQVSALSVFLGCHRIYDQ